MQGGSGVKGFFEDGAVNELEFYKSTLEFHISLLEEGDARRLTKEERLSQINTYLEAIILMRHNYKDAVTDVLSKPSNLHGIVLRPLIKSCFSTVVNPVFTVNRGDNHHGTPLSPLYNAMHNTFTSLTLGKSDPRAQLVTEVLN